jgi:hypothetical protein
MNEFELSESKESTAVYTQNPIMRECMKSVQPFSSTQETETWTIITDQHAPMEI